MVRLSRIYTRTGDDGSTGLVDGSRVPKDDPRVNSYGTVDELSAQLGMASTLLQVHPLPLPEDSEAMGTLIAAIQQDLFDVGSLLATPSEADLQLPSITDAHVLSLERSLDAYNDELETLKSFVLPGGQPVAAALHVARTVCRRAERLCLSLEGCQDEGRRILAYLNRLSDLLFVLARWVNHRAGVAEPLWTPGGGTLADKPS